MLEGGGVAELAACARNLDVTALYVLHEGEWTPYFVDAPEFVNRPFTELYAGGLPALTPLVVRSGAPPGGWTGRFPATTCKSSQRITHIGATNHVTVMHQVA